MGVQESMVAITGVLMSTIVPIALFLMIYFIEKEKSSVKKKMLENGINPEDNRSKGFGGGSLKWGGLLIGGGLGLFLAKLLEENLGYSDTDPLYFGLIALFGGIGLVVAHNIARKQYREDNNL